MVGAEGKVLGKIPSCVGQETPLLLNLWKSEWNLCCQCLPPPSLELGPLNQSIPKAFGKSVRPQQQARENHIHTQGFVCFISDCFITSVTNN